MFLKCIISGVIVKAIASFDDFLTRIPLLAELTKTRKGKIAFSLGNLLAVFVVMFLAIIFAVFIDQLPYAHLISAVLIFILAGLVYCEVFVVKPKSILEKKLLKIEKISAQRFFKLLGIGFIISFITLIDDTIVLAGLFLGKEFYCQVWISSGIIAVTLLELVLIVYFSEKIFKLKYKKELATLGMVVVGLLILFGVI